MELDCLLLEVQLTSSRLLIAFSCDPIQTIMKLSEIFTDVPEWWDGSCLLSGLALGPYPWLKQRHLGAQHKHCGCPSWLAGWRFIFWVHFHRLPEKALHTKSRLYSTATCQSFSSIDNRKGAIKHYHPKIGSYSITHDAEDSPAFLPDYSAAVLKSVLKAVTQLLNAPAKTWFLTTCIYQLSSGRHYCYSLASVRKCKTF